LNWAESSIKTENNDQNTLTIEHQQWLKIWNNGDNSYYVNEDPQASEMIIDES